MAVWVVRGGEPQDEDKALDTGVLGLGYGLFKDLAGIVTWQDIQKLLGEGDREAKASSTGSKARQIWKFKDKINLGDLVVMPRRRQGTIAIGEMEGEYQFLPDASHLFHTRKVRWINKEVRRASLGQDLQKSMDAQGAVYEPKKENAPETRLRTAALTGKDPGVGGTNEGDTSWDAFVEWARLFYEWDQFHEMERGYKLRAGEELGAVKRALADGSPDWEDFLTKTLRDPANGLRDWRASNALVDLDMSKKAEALRRIWGIGSLDSLQERVRGFQEFGPFGTAGVMASILLMAEDPTLFPLYGYTPLKTAYQLTGYPVEPNDSADTWERYEHALGFFEEFRKQASNRGLQITDLLDAQSLVWCVTRYKKDFMPDDWPEDVKEQLISYRTGRSVPPPAPPPKNPWSPSNIAILANQLLWQTEELSEVIEDLQEKRQVIFYGPPGTGKTYVAKAIAQQCRRDSGDFEIVQFHPSYSYEDFVEGFRPRLIDGQPGFELVGGPLLRIADKARERPESTFVLVIDELNRGNVAKVFGELYFLLEYRDERVQLQYGSGREGFSLPSNLWFICTMNTADRSIALMDAALRRRFYFAPFFPDEPPIKGLLHRWLIREGQDTLAADLVDAANAKLDRDMGIGPSYFMSGGTLDRRRVSRIWSRSVLPYIEEQFFGDSAKLAEFNLERLTRQVEGTVETDMGIHSDQLDGADVPVQDGDDDADTS